MASKNKPDVEVVLDKTEQPSWMPGRLFFRACAIAATLLYLFLVRYVFMYSTIMASVYLDSAEVFWLGAIAVFSVPVMFLLNVIFIWWSYFKQWNGRTIFFCAFPLFYDYAVQLLLPVLEQNFR